MDALDVYSPKNPLFAPLAVQMVLNLYATGWHRCCIYMQFISINSTSLAISNPTCFPDAIWTQPYQFKPCDGKKNIGRPWTIDQRKENINVNQVFWTKIAKLNTKLKSVQVCGGFVKYSQKLVQFCDNFPEHQKLNCFLNQNFFVLWWFASTYHHQSPCDHFRKPPRLKCFSSDVSPILNCGNKHQL